MGDPNSYLAIFPDLLSAGKILKGDISASGSTLDSTQLEMQVEWDI